MTRSFSDDDDGPSTGLARAVAAIQRESDELQTQIGELGRQIQQAPQPDPRVVERRFFLEERSSGLMCRYVVGHRLLGCVGFDSLMTALCEILENLVGIARFAVYIFKKDGRTLTCCASGAPTPAEAEKIGATVALGQGPIGLAAEEDRVFVLGPEKILGASVPPLIGWFPLLLHGKSIGGIAAMELLTQKYGFEGVDLQVIDLISNHAAEVMVASVNRSDEINEFFDLPEVATHLRESQNDTCQTSKMIEK